MMSALITLPFSFTVNAALSATTALTIEGTKPYLLLSDGTTKLTKLNELLGFKMPKQNGSAGTEQITSDTISLIAPAGMKYSDVITLVTADGASHNVQGAVVGDSDGDATITANTSVTGSMKATWYNGGVQVQPADFGKALTVCGGPYTLQLEAANVQANTTYGAPNINYYGSTTTPITYTFTANGHGICYLKPASMQIYTTDVSITGGYNTAKFDTTNGFKVNSGFPTTGFYKAVFSLIGSGNDQSKFRCNTSSTDITLSSTGLGANCTVTYNTVTKPTSPITINMEYNNSGTWTQIDSFTIPTPTKWAISKGEISYGNSGSLSTSTIFPALNACRTVGTNADNGTTIWQEAAGQSAADRTFRQQFMYRRNELTNSPYANTAEGTSPASGGYFSRDADGTFMGEWGNVYKYGSSGWSLTNVYWTAEAGSIYNQFRVNEKGEVSYYMPSQTYVAVCRGE